MMIKGMRETAIDDMTKRIEKSESYNEGLQDGFAEGYDRAIADVQGILKKYHVGTEKQDMVQEKELKPAIRFLGISQRALIDKIVEECDEVVQAYNDGESKERLAEEIADVQEACETALAGLGLHEKERRVVRLQVIKKNAHRGYYMPPRSKFGD
jgi:NTP pyrophosphatase (non-canonical NTP hydrolase)